MKKLKQAFLLSICTLLISCQEQMLMEQGTPLNESGSQTSSTQAAPIPVSSDLAGVQYEEPITTNITGNEGEFMAIIKPGYSEEQILQTIGATVTRIKTYIPRFRMIAFSATSTQIYSLMNNPLIQAIQVDVDLKMHLSTATTQVRAREVRDHGVEGEGARVCIIDSGINYHRDLNIPEVEYDFVESDDKAEDDNGHGTAVAGIVSSMDEDLAFVKGNSGVAPRATLLIAKVFGPDGTASGSTIASALDWCAKNKADVINMSLGHGGFISSCDTDFTALFSNKVAGLGIIVVAASGNDGFTDRVSSPACGSKVLGVGSVNKQDMKSSFSNAGSEVALSAPGEGIMTTTASGSYGSFSGTSAATPFVAGAAALLKSMPENPDASKIKEALIRGAKDLGTPGKDSSYGQGRLDVAASYNYIRSMGGSTGGTSGGVTGGGTSGGFTGETSGGSTGGVIQPEPPSKFKLGIVTKSNEAKSNSFRSSQRSIVKDCPADHYLTDLEVQGATWFIYPSITWFRMECQALKSLNTSTEFGKRQGSSVRGNLCSDKKAIIGLDIKSGSNIKDLRSECADLSYDTTKAGAVKLTNPTVSRYALGRSFFLDDKESLTCPENMVAVGIDASYKSDSDEWAFTRLALRCAMISTSK
jgi:subtilisin family serine protease